MRKKEDILKSNIGLIPFIQLDGGQGPCITKAMDEFAKEVVNDFINWLYAPLTDRSDLWEQYQQEKSFLK